MIFSYKALLEEGINLDSRYRIDDRGQQGILERYELPEEMPTAFVCNNDHAAYLLNTTSLPIIDIAMETGFNNRQHFTRTFGKLYGMPPHEYRHVNHVSYVKTPGLRNGPSSGSGESGVST